MTKLKPQLIVAGPSKKKGGFVSSVGYFLVLIIVFVLGIYVGMGVNGPDFNTEQTSVVNHDDTSSIQPRSSEPSIEAIEAAQNDRGQDIIGESVVVSDSNNVVEHEEDTKSSPSTFAGVEEAEDAIVVSSIDDSVDGSGIFFDASLDGELLEQDTYRLQVAAFGSIDQANEVVNSLKLRGYDAYIVTTSNSRGEVWNLIKVGKFNTAQEAWNYSAIYQSKEGGEVFVESLSKGRVYNESLEEKNDTL